MTNGWDRPPLQSTQLGYRGTGMAQVTNLRRYIETPTAQLPPPIPEVPAGGPMATEQFKNLTVLTDVSSAEPAHHGRDHGLGVAQGRLQLLS